MHLHIIPDINKLYFMQYYKYRAIVFANLYSAGHILWVHFRGKLLAIRVVPFK